MEIGRVGEGFGYLISPSKGGKAGDFVDTLKEFVEWVNAQQNKADSLKESVLEGDDVPLHRMVIELEKAGLALNLLVEIRNRLLESYQELTRMQI